MIYCDHSPKVNPMTWKARKTRNGRWTWKSAAITLGKKALKVLNACKHSLILIVNHLLVKGNIHFIKPSIRSLQQILKERYGICVGRRWIFQCLKDLEDLGFILRKSRPGITTEGKPHWLSSMIVFTVRGVMYLKQCSIEGSGDRWKKTLEWIKRNDKRFPSESELIADTHQDLISKNLARVKDLIKDIVTYPAGGRTPAPIKDQ